MKNLFATLALIVLCQPVIAQDLAFDLPDIDGDQVRLEKAESQKLTVVCFLGTECPLAKLYTTRLNELNSEFSTVDFLGVCSNRQDSEKDLLDYRLLRRLVLGRN